MEFEISFKKKHFYCEKKIGIHKIYRSFTFLIDELY